MGEQIQSLETPLRLDVIESLSTQSTYRAQLARTARSKLFSEAEAAYLKTQRLARIATVSQKGIPEVSPVGFEFDGKYFWIGSHSQDIFLKTRRYRNITGGNARVSIVIDDLASVNPWRPRGIKVSGTAEVMEHEGMFGKGKYFRITPKVSVSWGIEPPSKGRWTSSKRWQQAD